MKNTLTLLATILSIFSLQAQVSIINTVAGGGTQTPGPGVLADSAFISGPYGVAVDHSGNIYFASPDQNAVFRVDASTNTISHFAGNLFSSLYAGSGGLADTSELNQPTGVAVDDTGNVYIADNGNDRICKVTIATGILTTIAGNGIPGLKGDNGPAVSAEINGPTGVAVDDSGNVYIADRQNNRIRKVSGGIITTIAGKDTVNSDGGFSGDGGLADSAQLAQPTAVAVDHHGNVYICDESNNRIRMVSHDTITSIVGSGPGGSTGTFSGDGGLADTAGIYYPTGVAIDASGNLYILDSQNLRVRKVSNGIITTFAGNGTAGFKGDGGPADSAEINGQAAGLGVDVSGNVYIGDFFNVRVRKVTVTAAAITQVTPSQYFHIYPNPAGTMLYIEQLQPGQPIVITNLLGQTLSKTIAGNTQEIVDISQLSTGMYFVNGTKFIKQ